MLNPEVPPLIQAIYGVPAPPTPRYDLFEVFLTGIVTNDELDVDGRPATANPIDVDLNSQALNADAATVPAVGDAAAEHVDHPSDRPGRRPLAQPAGSVSSVATSRASRTAGAWPTTSSTSSCSRSRASTTSATCRPTARRFQALNDGDKVNRNDNAFSDAFPYIAGPNTDAVNAGGPAAGRGARSHPGGRLRRTSTAR